MTRSIARAGLMTLALTVSGCALTFDSTELGVRTFFNVLGPLCNPAGAKYQALGVADGSMAGKMADVLIRLGVERAIVFHAGDGMDELSVSSPSLVMSPRPTHSPSRRYSSLFL